MQCEKCRKDHDGSYATGRFCSKSCATSWASRVHLRERLDKVKAAFAKKRVRHCGGCEQDYTRPRGWRRDLCPLCYKKLKRPAFEKLGNNEARKRWLFKEVGRHCWKCGLIEWNGLPIPLELDHISGNREDNRRENVQVLCPNCHAQTPTWKWRNRPDRKKTQ